jgi:hypothetical protein
MRAKGSIQVGHEELVSFLQVCSATTKGEVIYARKALLSKVMPAYSKMLVPQHTQIGLDPYGILPRSAKFNLRIIEASLFEDMCALFNLAHNFHNESVKTRALDKRILKTAIALCRATISSAFYFVESYINGVAFEYLATAGDGIDQATKDFLSEWDSARNRPKYVKTRDKLLHYPRIVLGASHPPLQENNCPPLAFIVTKAKQFRDAIVHASPIADANSFKPEKEMAIFTLKFRDVEETVDNAVALVFTIEPLVHGNLDYILWLARRGPDGLFPESVFS